MYRYNHISVHIENIFLMTMHRLRIVFWRLRLECKIYLREKTLRFTDIIILSCLTIAYELLWFNVPTMALVGLCAY